MFHYLYEIWRLNSAAELYVALLAAGLTLLILFFLRHWLVGRFKAAPLVQRPFLQELLIHLVQTTHGLLLLVIALSIGFVLLEHPRETIAAGQFAWPVRLLLSAVLIQTGIWATQALNLWLERYRAVRFEQDAAAVTMMTMLVFIGKLVLFVLIVLLIIKNMGGDVGALLASLGIAGVAVGLAAQKILGDLFSSVSIVLDQPFVIGDFIVVDDKMGNVEKIGLKTTRVRSLTGEQLIFSNADLLQSRIHNFKRQRERRVLFTFGVTYETPTEQLRAIPELVRQIIEAQPDTRFERAHFKELGASSLNFEVVYFMTVPDYNPKMDVQQTINLELMERLAARGVAFAYPTQTLIVQRREQGRGVGNAVKTGTEKIEAEIENEPPA